MGIYLPGTETLGCVVWPGAGIACSQGVPPNFYPPYMNVGLLMPIPPLPPFCITLLSPHLFAPPTYLDECGFFKSLVVKLPYSSIF